MQMLLSLQNFVGTRPSVKRLKKGAIPHIFPWSQAESESAKGRRERGEKRKREEEERELSYQEVAANETVACDCKH